MLVLSRKVGETIVINGNIRVMITELRGDKIRIGVDAPTDVSIDRQEVYEAKLRSSNAQKHMENRGA